MDASSSEEQRAIRTALRDVLAKRSGPGDVRAAVCTAAGYDEELWSALAGRLGLPGLAVPCAYGGAGCGSVELALAFEEAGRVLLPSPLFATSALAAPLIALCGTEEQRGALLPPLAAGEATATLAVPGGALARALGLAPAGDEAARTANGCWSGGGRAGGMQARRTDGGWRLFGEAGQVPHGHTAGLLLVAAHTGGFARSRTLLFLVRGSAPGTARARQTALDETRAVARVELRNTPAELLGANDESDAGEALARLGPRAAAVLAAEAVGAADSALARTVDHVKARHQFGRPIGSFQAVQHRLADVHVQVRAARSAAYYAAWAADHAQAEAGTAGGLALAQGLTALRLAAGEAVQLHGGIGFTWEHEAHLYFKRAAGDELLFGPVHRLRTAAAERAGLSGGRTAADSAVAALAAVPPA
ncbi:acyl-CoA dehydrogenase family protein [Streptomyces boncukensis]|uniref:Acyl-CoA dehydrogenase n=1 Tax=Streptomyces boncukensis TaxID=2711219 RepID=A0A6G4WWY5_9ACTN|nr:acyl-CoA dehydrogenase family protein [Streptomyces boncukensis]NGO69140.1 acyl-CoA dehydrogenase [Streptomyces boncukensis]